jgi:hypothetical protein
VDGYLAKENFASLDNNILHPDDCYNLEPCSMVQQGAEAVSDKEEAQVMK